MRTGWRLGVTLILFAASAVVLRMAPPVKGAVNPVSLYAVPMTLGTWVGAEGVPEEILPPDPNEKISVRRTYRNGNHLAWVSVALFVGQDDDARRASINKIYPQRGASLIEPVSFAVPLDGSAAGPITLPAVIVHQDSRRLLVAYWHQIGNRVYGNEYRFRLALMRDVIFARRADTVLVRIATPAGAEPQVADDLAVVAGLAPSIYAALSQETGK
ncbi:MAG: EpsI family protein [Candidatus Rokubacteria bacterium]|nr:EpsI family protein [Candidatus Rokubacteria bacterium]